MKAYWKFVLAAVICLAVYPDNFYGEGIKFPCLGVVRASKLACRKSPSLESPVIKYYTFGSPLILVDKSSSKTRVGKMKEHWYKDKKTSGWLYGGFLMLSSYNRKDIKKFKSERIWCNVACGGFSCFYEFEPLLLGRYYVAYVYLNDYPQDRSPVTGIIIGTYILKDDYIQFSNALDYGGYDGSGIWVKNLKKIDFDTKGFILNSIGNKYYRVRDKEGYFYVTDKSKVPDREVNRKKCKNKKTSEEIWVNTNYIINAGLDDFKSLIPLPGY